MPISKEKQALYPANWKSEIRPRILERAGHRCERCKRPNRQTVWVFANGTWHGVDEARTDTGDLIEAWDMLPEDEPRVVETVLTIAHFDHDPTNNSDSNLFAWCQRCHLRHDIGHHATNSAVTRARKRQERQTAAGVLSLAIGAE